MVTEHILHTKESFKQMIKVNNLIKTTLYVNIIQFVDLMLVVLHKYPVVLLMQSADKFLKFQEWQLSLALFKYYFMHINESV